VGLSKFFSAPVARLTVCEHFPRPVSVAILVIAHSIHTHATAGHRPNGLNVGTGPPPKRMRSYAPASDRRGNETPRPDVYEVMTVVKRGRT
jgi:hypothetical protein